jgi:hypothetical protein
MAPATIGILICHSDKERSERGGICYLHTAFMTLSGNSRFLLVATLLVGMTEDYFAALAEGSVV